jgi:hypothetical protein
MALLCFLWGSKAFTQAPPNDLCANAIDLVCGDTIDGTVINATPTNGYQLLPDVWYRVSNIAGSASVSLCGTVIPFDSRIRVFKPGPFNPSCLPGMTLVAQNDDFCGALSRVTWNAVAGEVYYIQVNDWGGASGPPQAYGPFRISAACTPLTPSNDECLNPIPVQCGTTTAGTTVSAMPDLGFASPGVWYSVVGTGYPIEASLCGQSNYDNAIHIYSHDCNNLILEATDDNSCTQGGTRAKVSFPTQLGVIYKILVNGAGTASGNFELAIACPDLTPPNDLCNNPILVGCNSVTQGTTYGATGAQLNGPDVWYSFVGTGTLVTASLCGSGNFDSYMQVQQLAGLDCSAGTTNSWNNDDFCGVNSQVTFMAQSGVIYLIRVAGFGPNDVGPFVLTVTCDNDIIPNNDECPGAIPVACGGDYFGTTRNATPDDISPPFSPGATTLGVWYVLKGTGQQFTVSTCYTGYDSYIYVYSGSCGDLTYVESDDDGCNLSCHWSLSSLDSFMTVVGVDYYILVGGYSTATGNFNLRVMSKDCESKPGEGCRDEKPLLKTDLAPLTKEKAPFKVISAPNPSTDYVDFYVNVALSGAAHLRIMDLKGQLVAVRDLGELEEGQHTVRHDWQDIPAGVYLYEFRVGEAQQTGKLQVLR